MVDAYELNPCGTLGVHYLRKSGGSRTNYLFVGSDDGGEWAATAYSLIESCRIAGVIARTYLAAITDELLNRPGVDPAGLTPRRWAEGQRSQVA